MRALAWNIMATLLWVLLSGHYSLGNFILGFIFGYMVLLFCLRKNPSFNRYFYKVPTAIHFMAFFIYDLVIANVKVAYDIVTPTHMMKPAVLKVPITLKGDAQIALFGNLITVTPGSLALDVSSDKQWLFVHVMYLEDEPQQLAQFRALETRIKNLVGGYDD